MKKRISGLLIICLAVVLMYQVADMYEGFLALAIKNNWIHENQRFLYVGQRLFYILVFAASVPYGITLLIAVKRNSIRRIFCIFFITISTLWMILELPIYPCYYGVGHSIWTCNNFHLH